MYIRVRVFPQSKNEQCLEKSPGVFEIHCKEKTENNNANVRIREVLANYLNMPLSSIKIISGHRRPQKMIEIIK